MIRRQLKEHEQLAAEREVEAAQDADAREAFHGQQRQHITRIPDVAAVAQLQVRQMRRHGDALESVDAAQRRQGEELQRLQLVKARQQRLKIAWPESGKAEA